MFFWQIKQHGDNFSYIVADDSTGEAAVVDSSFNGDEITRIIKTEKLKLKYLINTHSHPDHTAGNEKLRLMFDVKTVSHKLSRGTPDIEIENGDVIDLGNLRIHVIHTPGHTPDSVCLLLDKKILTGDTLFVGECGRTDLPGGSPRSLYNSLFNKLLKLPDEIRVYPGHDYGPKPYSTIGEEKRTNYTLKPRSLEIFVAFMNQP